MGWINRLRYQLPFTETALRSDDVRRLVENDPSLDALVEALHDCPIQNLPSVLESSTAHRTLRAPNDDQCDHGPGDIGALFVQARTPDFPDLRRLDGCAGLVQDVLRHSQSTFQLRVACRTGEPFAKIETLDRTIERVFESMVGERAFYRGWAFLHELARHCSHPKEEVAARIVRIFCEQIGTGRVPTRGDTLNITQCSDPTIDSDMNESLRLLHEMGFPNTHEQYGPTNELCDWLAAIIRDHEYSMIYSHPAYYLLIDSLRRSVTPSSQVMIDCTYRQLVGFFERDAAMLDRLIEQRCLPSPDCLETIRERDEDEYWRLYEKLPGRARQALSVT